MIVEDQNRLTAFQDAQTAYAGFLRRWSQGDRVSFREFISEHQALEPILVRLHETFRQTGRQTGRPEMTGVTSPARGATTVVDRRRRDDRLEALAAEVEPPMAPSPSRPTTDKRYVPLGELARGGMGAILKVWDRELGRTLAMKVLLDEGSASRGRTGAEHLARFLQEAQVIARLDHPGIVPVHDVGFDQEGRPYFTMRYVDGLDLDDVFDRARADRDGWNLSRAVASIVKTCQTMAYAHARGIIHRDLKPGNVMVGRFGEAYVIDWGLAKVLHGQIFQGQVFEERRADEETVNLRRLPGSANVDVTTAPPPAPQRARRSVHSGDGVVVGTPPFMPPEQAEGKDLDPRSDVYSLGAILYTLLTGHAPYAPLDGSVVSAAEMTDRVLEGPPTAVRELAEQAPARLAAICEKAMVRDPSDRYQSAMDMAEDLQSHLDGRITVHAPGVVARVREWANGNRAAAGFAGVAVFLMTLLPGIVAVSPDADEDRPVPEQANLREAPREPEAKPGEKRCVAKSHAECGDAQSS